MALPNDDLLLCDVVKSIVDKVRMSLSDQSPATDAFENSERKLTAIMVAQLLANSPRVLDDFIRQPQHFRAVSLVYFPYHFHCIASITPLTELIFI